MMKRKDNSFFSVENDENKSEKKNERRSTNDKIHYSIFSDLTKTKK